MLISAGLSVISSLGINIGSWFTGATVELDPIYNGLKSQSNGDLTPEEIEQQKNDDDLPYSDDVFREYVVKETDKYVVFVRKLKDKSNQTIYPNISFVKTSNGLIWDGAWGVTAYAKTNWFTGWHDWDNMEIYLNMDLISYEKSQNSFFLQFLALIGTIANSQWSATGENIVTFSDFNCNFCLDFKSCNGLANLFMNEYNETLELQNRTRQYLVDYILNKHFSNLTDNDTDSVEMIMGQDDNSTLSLINSWATYLWKQVKTEDKSNNAKLVDISHYFIKLIPDDLRSNYPIPVNKQSEYDGKQYYDIYDCKIFADVAYMYDNLKIERDSKKIENNIKDIEIAPIPPAQTVEYARINVKLNNVENSDLTMFDITENPVLIQFTNAENDFNKLTNFKTNNDFLNGMSIAVPYNKVLYYDILSDELIFDSYNGLISINKMHFDLKFNFTYEYSFVETYVSIDPTTSISAGVIDLENYPVRIVLTGQNNEGVYEFAFDNNTKLTIKLNQLIKKGTYTYSIISNQLLFYPKTGNITVTAIDRDFIFNYHLESESSDLNFSVNVKSGNFWTSPGSAFAARFDEETAQLLSYKFTGSPNLTCQFDVSIKIFDTDQTTVLRQRNEKYNGYNWFESYRLAFLNDFENDTEYFAKITFTENQTGAFYVTDLISFQYFFGTDYKFEITAEEV